MATKYIKYGNKLVTINGKLLNVDISVDGAVEKTLESKTITPTQERQIITPTDSQHELAQVIVESIPDEYLVSDYTFSFDETTGTLTITNGD